MSDGGRGQDREVVASPEVDERIGWMRRGVGELKPGKMCVVDGEEE